jgi:ATP-dependent Lon protease
MATTPTGGNNAASMVVLAIPNQVLFPGARVPIDLPRKVFDELSQLIEAKGASEIVVVALQPKRGTSGVPYDIATACQLVSHTAGDSKAATISQGSASGSGSTIQLQVEGRKRARILKFVSGAPASLVRMAHIEMIDESHVDDGNVAVRALVHSVHEKVAELVKQAQDKNKTAMGKRSIKLPPSASALADMVGTVMTQLSVEERQRILETLDVQQRMELVMDYLQRETEAQKMSSEIHTSMQKAREVEIRQAILQRQIQEVQKGLQRLQEKAEKTDEFHSEDDGEEKDERARLAETIDKANLPHEAKRIAKKELKRLKNIQPQHPEYTIAHTYLETLASLPWKISSKDQFDMMCARAVLESDHQGLEKVKKRILEFLAVQKMRGNMNGPILCFHGPPGIGKTSLGKSIARSLGRKFHRIALGGVRDEAELRGHRRTYIGSMAGNIIQALQTTGVNNPVILLDEIDKMSQNQMFNPQATLLEILDPEQNSTFKDHYINTAFDLSKVLFIATANDTSLIDRPLLDRMEVIELSGYTVEEKVGIAQEHLLPKQRRLHALEAELSPSDETTVSVDQPDVSASLDPRLVLGPEALRALITRWTAESGVRNLERRLAQICRWSVLRLQGVGMVESSDEEKDDEKDAVLASTGPDANGCVTVDAHHLPYIVGVELYEPDIAERLSVGVAMGLSVSGVGGQLLFIEATRTAGSGRLTITGQLGKVMTESVETAMSLLRSRFVRNGERVTPLMAGDKGPTTNGDDADNVPQNPFKGEDIHVHFPAGGIPKDGPSAGVAVLLALTSLLLGKPMRSDTAVTGEVSLRGHVLPVGGIRDKILAAQRAGIQHVLIPLANKRHVLDEVPTKTLEDIEVHYVKHVDEALTWAFGTLTAGQQDSTADVAEQYQAELPPGVPAAAVAALGDFSRTVLLPPSARL